MTVSIVHRKPSVAEFESLVKSVGFRGHDHGAVEIALANSVFCACGEENGTVVGVGRIIGDSAIAFLLTSVMVRPSHQRQGIGTSIVKALCTCLERLPHKNIVLETVPEPGLAIFYAKLGFKASRNAVPGMVKWFNDERAANS